MQPRLLAHTFGRSLLGRVGGDLPTVIMSVDALEQAPTLERSGDASIDAETPERPVREPSVRQIVTGVAESVEEHAQRARILVETILHVVVTPEIVGQLGISDGHRRSPPPPGTFFEWACRPGPVADGTLFSSLNESRRHVSSHVTSRITASRDASRDRACDVAIAL